MRIFDYIMSALPERHALNGGTFVTITSGNDREEIAASVAEFGDTEIFMRGIELHCTRRPFNLSDFWAYHKMRVGQKDGN